MNRPPKSINAFEDDGAIRRRIKKRFYLSRSMDKRFSKVAVWKILFPTLVKRYVVRWEW